MSITDYIKANHPSKASFARSQGINPQEVTKWINKGYIVLDGTIYSPRRKVIDKLQEQK